MAVGPNMDRFTISLNHQMRERLDTLAYEYSMTRSAIIAMLIKKKWEEEHHADGESGLVRER